MSDRVRRIGLPTDPDPLLLDLLVKVVAAAVAGVIIKAGKAIWRALPKQEIDRLTAGASAKAKGGPSIKLPAEFRAQIGFLENRLRDAGTASLAEQSFLEIKAAVMAMRHMVGRLERPERW